MRSRATRTRVKICGITRPEDAQAAASDGADAIGLVFYAGSSRCVTPEVGAAIARDLPPFVSVVALFVNPAPEEVRRVLASVPVDVLQFHGDESPAVCASYGRRYVKAIRVAEGADVVRLAAPWRDASALLLDTFRSNRWGGTGETFDWELVPEGLDRPVVLAGGLAPANVAAAIRAVRPHGVDVSGGVESAPGIKDPVRIREFIAEVNRVEPA